VDQEIELADPNFIPLAPRRRLRPSASSPP
jgi:hypothetical protein